MKRILLAGLGLFLLATPDWAAPRDPPVNQKTEQAIERALAFLARRQDSRGGLGRNILVARRHFAKSGHHLADPSGGLER